MKNCDLNFLFYSEENKDCKHTLEALREISSGSRAESYAWLVRRLVAFASEFGLEGNVWQHWLAYVLIMHENPFTLACERMALDTDAALAKLARPDICRFRELFFRKFDDDLMVAITDYRSPYASEAKSSLPEVSPGFRIRSFSEKLADSCDEDGFFKAVTDEYALYGCGAFAICRAFRVSEDSGEMKLVPIAESMDVTMDDLIGYESQKETLRANTEAFVSGLHANNVLLHGDSGTGKSTSVHALMHEYFGRGMRLVEISKPVRALMPQVLSEIKKRNYRFIIFLDDLSFEENESDYKELKAMLEGALETREDRVLIYATSNRRHLIRETWNDRRDMEYQEDIHRSDTMEEKLSLASRFGVTIYYSKPDPKEYLHIVRELAERNGIELTGSELEDAARKWELRHGGMSGRTASQLITWLKK